MMTVNNKYIYSIKFFFTFRTPNMVSVYIKTN